MPEHASYTLTAGNAADYPDLLAGLDTLCAYVDSHRAQLVADYRRRRDQADFPPTEMPPSAPAPRDTVINYWPVKSSVYPTGH